MKRPGPNRRLQIALRSAAFCLACGVLAALASLAWRFSYGTTAAHDHHASGRAIPAYSDAPPVVLPDTVAPDNFSGPLIREAYADARQIKPLLAQLPCYCFCDRTMGHRGLLDCFTSYHAARCWACRREAIYAYQQAKRGLSPTQIRQAIVAGAWREPAAPSHAAAF